MKIRTAAAIGVASLLLVTACFSDDDSGGGDDTGTGDATTTTVEAPENAEPVRGGTLIYAVEADTSSPWLPSAMLCAAACHSTVGRTVYEPLVLVGNDGNAYPYLLESITPNADSTEFTLVVRDGILFHDGTPMDADAVAANLEANRTSALVGPAVQPITSVASDGALTVTIAMSAPWPAFPYYLNSQLGYMGSPTWLAAVAAGTASPTEPVGTGPFQYESYESGENGRFTATRFADYWRGDGPNSVTGEGLPYLDAVEVRFAPDSDARTRSLTSGDVGLIATANAVEIQELVDDGSFNVTQLDTPYEQETSYLLLNHMAEVGGQPNPFADPRVRRALALATDQEVIQQTRAAGLFPVANGPFPPGREGYLEDTGFPTYDPEAARALLEEVSAETGGPVAVALKTTTDPFNLTTSELLQQMWEDVGFTVTIDQIPQGEFIGQALQGNFEVFTWRNHPGVNLDQQFVWWSSTTTQGIALNFGRIIDDQVDALLDTARTSTDEAARATAAEDISRLFAENVDNVWLYWGWWAMATSPDVHQAGTLTIPDAPDGVTALIGGVVTPIEIFMDG